MLSKSILCVAIGAPVTFVLQGCGGDPAPGPAPAPSPSPAPAPAPAPSPGPSPGPSPDPAPGPAPGPAPATKTTTTTTTTTTPERTPGWSAETAVQELNEMYMAFDESNDSTALGVTISYVGQTGSFDDNFFCEGYTDTTCYQGQADCRLSAAILNHKVMVRQTNTDGVIGTVVQPLMSRAIGYVFNQTLVENYFGKCTYLYDGAAQLKLNQGCGAVAPLPADCDNEHSAFHNMCTSDGGATYHHCIATDPEVVSQKCAPYGEVTPPTHPGDVTCFYEMPALIVPHEDPKSFSPSGTNHLRDALKQRVEGDLVTNQAMEWNEVIIDNRLFLPQLNYDPTHTITAFFYVIGSSMSDEAAQHLATSMRDQFQETYGVKGVGDIPVVELDARNDFATSGGPFKLPSASRVVV